MLGSTTSGSTSAVTVIERLRFSLNIEEGCVMNKLIQPQNLSYSQNGKPDYKIACCLLKEEISK